MFIEPVTVARCPGDVHLHNIIITVENSTDWASEGIAQNLQLFPNLTFEFNEPVILRVARSRHFKPF